MIVSEQGGHFSKIDTMKKRVYIIPETEALELNLKTAILEGSPGAGGSEGTGDEEWTL